MVVGTVAYLSFKLPYVDPVAMCVIDPMHNLLLGTAKHMVRIWKERELIKQNQFEEIQSLVDSFVVPNDVGRIPCWKDTILYLKYSGFTAEQWRNWTVLFSLHCLKHLLPFRDFFQLLAIVHQSLFTFVSSFNFC